MERYFHSALAPSSQRTYSSAQHRYINFCSSFSLTPLPLCEHQICQFASYLANQGLSHSTIKSYISAIRHLQISHGLPDPGIPDMPKLEGVMKGIKATQARSNTTSPKRLPITTDILGQIYSIWEAEGPLQDHKMLWAAVTLSFFGFLRSGEVTVPSDTGFDASVHFTFEDIAVDNALNPSFLKIRLKASKTDPFRRGVDIVVGRTGNKLCPVTAMLAYLAVRGNGPGFLFRFQDGKLLTKNCFVDAVRATLLRLGLNPKKYSGHSFRIGAATTAGACGLSDSIIQMLGRWSSSAYLVYIRTPREQLAQFSKAMCIPTS